MELAVAAADSPYLALSGNAADALEDLADLASNNLSRPFSFRSLAVAKISPGGVPQWIIPGPSGEEYASALTGVILHHWGPRNWWPHPMVIGEKTRPECSSPDGVTGYGLPGGSCAACPLSKWGPKDENGRGEKPKCAERRDLLLLVQDRALPFLISLPATSIGNAEKYGTLCSQNGVAIWKVETTLRVETRMGAARFGACRFEMGRKLNAGEVFNIRPIRTQFMEMQAAAARAAAFAGTGYEDD